MLTLTPSVSSTLIRTTNRSRRGIFSLAVKLGSLALCCWIASTQLSHAAEVYRWVDENGVVNYTQQKPRNVAVQALTTQAGAPTRVREQPAAETQGQPGESDQLEMTDAQQRMMQELQAKEQARQQEVAELRQDNCEKARSVLSNLSAKERIRVRGDDGMERIMAEDERQRRISEAQKGIVENCASA